MGLKSYLKKIPSLLYLVAQSLQVDQKFRSNEKWPSKRAIPKKYGAIKYFVYCISLLGIVLTIRKTHLFYSYSKNIFCTRDNRGHNSIPPTRYHTRIEIFMLTKFNFKYLLVFTWLSADVFMAVHLLLTDHIKLLKYVSGSSSQIVCKRFVASLEFWHNSSVDVVYVSW